MPTVMVVPHTHWDREWYFPFERYRYRLVRLIDRLLTLIRDEGYPYFLLDGQAIVAEDYLEICPENEAPLREAVSQGRIGIGPWYTMPDEFIVSGEGLIRNLLVGHSLGERLGRVTKIGYLPDPFGHVAQMPQILRGFDIDFAFMARGVVPTRSEFVWEAPDGSRVLAHWFPAGYCSALRLTPNPEDFARGPFTGLRSLLSFLEELASTDTILLMNGCDHVAPQEDISEVLEALNRRMPDYRFVHASLEDFASCICERNPDLETVRGELRRVMFAPLLPGVLSSRIHLKQRNHAVQTALEAYAEPIAAFAWTLGEPYPDAFILHAWKLLLQNHFHDSICGSSVDQTHREMLPRFDRAEQVACEVSDDYLARIGSKIAPVDEGIPILVFNPASLPRTERVDAWIVPRRRLPQGRHQSLGPEDLDLSRCILLDGERVIPFGIGERRLESHDVLNRVKHVEAVRITFQAEDVPPFGYKVYLLRPGEKAGHGAERDLPAGDGWLENEFFRVEAGPDGTLTVTDKTSGLRYEGLLYFEDSGDAGDEYNYCPPPKQTVVESRGLPAEVDLGERGPGWAALRIRTELTLPASLAPDRKSRSTEVVPYPLTTWVTLQRGVRRIDLRIEVENRAQDHRLRVAFPLGARVDKSIAESAFCVVERPVALPQEWGPAEKPYPTHPQARFVAVEAQGRGLAVLNKGLPEYEVDREGVVYITLLRCVGWLSRDDLDVRPGHAGPPYPVPDAQCPGKYTFELALVPYSGSWLEARIWREAEAFTRPMKALRIEPAGELPSEQSFLRVEPDTLLVSAVKKAEGDEALVVRLWNISSEGVRGKLKLHRPVNRAYEVNLLEREIGSLPVRGNEVEFPVRGCEIKTIKLYLAPFTDAPGL